MKKEKINQNVISHLMGNPSKNKALDTAGFPLALRLAGMTESGRSMIEMLGVLAVIGVLSVGGIAGYTSAMNKHRANELLNEASKRAVVVVPQIAMGNTPSIGEFTNPSDHNFELKGPNGNSDWKNTDKQFAITISGVSKEICQQMKNASGGVIKGFKPDTCADGATVILTYNNDMSTSGPEPCIGGYHQCYSGWGDNRRCIYGGTYPNCYAAGELCTEHDCYTYDYNDNPNGCLYGGEFPNCYAGPDCIAEGTCLCMPGECLCNYYGNYPDCNPEPVCLSNDRCYCESAGGGCWCSYGGTLPECNPRPSCMDDWTCGCSNGGECGCSYGGQYPNGCESKPNCLAAGTCVCEENSDGYSYYCYCKNGEEFPNGCNP